MAGLASIDAGAPTLAKLFRRDHAMRQSDSFLRSPSSLRQRHFQKKNRVAHGKMAWSWVEIGYSLSRDPK
jgi:hypothetical protein